MTTDDSEIQGTSPGALPETIEMRKEFDSQELSDVPGLLVPGASASLRTRTSGHSRKGATSPLRPGATGPLWPGMTSPPKNEEPREQGPPEGMHERRKVDRRISDRRASGARVHSSKPRVLTLVIRLTLEFVFIALVTTLIALSLLAISWEQRFQQYSNDQLESIAQTTVRILEKRYDTTGTWTNEVIDTLEDVSALSENFGIEVVDTTGKVLYSDLSSSSNGSAVATMPIGTKYELPVQYGNRGDRIVVGKVTVFLLPNIALSQSDQEFKVNTYAALLIAGVIAVTLAALVGIYLSRDLTRPLTHITSISYEVSSGDLSARTAMKGNDEFSRLGRAVDQMIATIEKNKNLERQLTADVAHELRTPLAAMRATIEAMIDGVLPTDTIRLATLNSEVIRLSHLVDVLLELSRLESGKTMIKMGVVDLSELIKELVLAHEMLIAEAGLSIECELDSGALARGDADLLRQAITNLLSNAVRYTPEGGHIGLKVMVQQGLVQVFVSDTGEGIAAEDIPHVFSRFWRAATSRDRESGGLGIGLAMVKEIMAKHRGAINVESEQGVGSTFTLTLPLLK